MLYDLHPRRATICGLREAVKIVREKNLVPGAVVGRRQLGDARCACIKERKASQCDCEQCTQVTLSLGRLNKSRSGWHTAYAATNSGKGCTCLLHDCSSESAAAAAAEAAAAQATSEAAARGADAEVWEAHAPSSQAAASAAAVAAEADAAAATAVATAKAAVEKLTAAKLRIQRYAAMSASEDALLATLLPCGRREFTEQTVTGEKTFKCYLRVCCEGNCPNRGNLFDRRKGSACGYDLVFEGYKCPVDNSDDEFIWLRWEKMLRNENKERETDDGKQAKPSYSMELVPHRGTRAEFMSETFYRGGKVSLWMPHIRRVRWCRQARRLIDDHKRGSRVAAAVNARAICAAARETALSRARAATPQLAALRIVAARNPWLNVGVVAAAAAPPPPEVVVPSSNGDDRQYAVVFNMQRIPLTLAALIRLAERDEADSAAAAAVAEAEAALTAATGKLRTAEQLHELYKLTMTVQSDYASQFETHRIHTATCAQPERHNLLVSIVGYKPYTEMMRKPGHGKKKKPVLEPVVKQHVDIFYAFHKAGFKPSARSFNVVQVID